MQWLRIRFFFKFQLILAEAKKKSHLYSSAFLARSTWFMNMFYLPSIHKLCALHKCIRPEIFEAEKLRFGRFFFLVRAFAQLNICQRKKPTQSCDEAQMHTFIEVYYVLFLMLLFLSLVYWSIGFHVPHKNEYVFGRCRWLWLPIRSQAPIKNGNKSRTKEMRTPRPNHIFGLRRMRKIFNNWKLATGRPVYSVISDICIIEWRKTFSLPLALSVSFSVGNKMCDEITDAGFFIFHGVFVCKFECECIYLPRDERIEWRANCQ